MGFILHHHLLFADMSNLQNAVSGIKFVLAFIASAFFNAYCVLLLNINKLSGLQTN